MKFSNPLEREKVGDKVRILSDIGEDLNDDRIGTITNIDGAYILIELDKSKVEVEQYPNEITKIWSTN